jgi:hypothetical protein
MKKTLLLLPLIVLLIPPRAHGAGSDTITNPKLFGAADLSGITNKPAVMQQFFGADPNADRILFWDDSCGCFTYLTVGSNLSISGTTLNASGGSGTVTGVTGTAPIASSGGTAPAISITAATTGAAGSMSAADKTKLDAITGTNTGDQDLSGKANITSPTFTGTPLAPTAAVDTNTTQLATTAFVIGQAYSKLASPTFTGTPTLPTGAIATTQSAGDSSTKLATTAFVTTADNLKANLASPTFTGTPTLPTGSIATTQSAGDSSTKLATTAFVTTADNLKANLASPTFTGTLTSAASTLNGTTNAALIVLPVNTSNSVLRVGPLEFQSYALNNLWFGDNVHFNGSNMQYQAAGFVEYQRWFNGQISLHAFDTGSSGGNLTNESNNQFKLKFDGSVALGGSIPITIDDYSGSYMLLKGGNAGLGVTTWGTSAAKVLGIGNGTEPSTSPADMVQLYSVDLSAGNATLGLRTETAVVTESVTSDRTLSIRINGTTYKLMLKI